MVNGSNSMSWKVDVVVDQVMQILLAKKAPPEVLVGSDARFLLAFMRMVPKRYFVFVYDLGYKLGVLPTPAAMLQ